MNTTSGRPLTEYQVTRIVALLTTTEMSFGEIAKRMECSRSTIASVNRRFAIRYYEGQRSQWKVERAPLAQETNTSSTPSLRRLA
jgi:IS30 family transposase